MPETSTYERMSLCGSPDKANEKVSNHTKKRAKDRMKEGRKVRDLWTRSFRFRRNQLVRGLTGVE